MDQQVLELGGGPVEIWRAGAGPAVLVAHGRGFGGSYRRNTWLAEALPTHQVISVSRPGYGQTPLATAATSGRRRCASTCSTRSGSRTARSSACPPADPSPCSPRAITRGASKASTPRVQVATLIMHGSEDDLVPVEHARYHAEQNPAAELEIVDGAGHGFMHSFRDETVTSYERSCSRPGRPSPTAPTG